MWRSLVPGPTFLYPSRAKAAFLWNPCTSRLFLTVPAGSSPVACCFWLFTWNSSCREVKISLILPARNRNAQAVPGLRRARISASSPGSLNTSTGVHVGLRSHGMCSFFMSLTFCKEETARGASLPEEGHRAVIWLEVTTFP